MADEQDLRRRLEAARAAQSRKSEDPVGRMTGQSGAWVTLAWRVVVEMIAALLVAALLGWVLDQALGSQPWMLVLFLLLGVGAGINNTLRAVRRMSGGPDKPAPPGPPEG